MLWRGIVSSVSAPLDLSEARLKPAITKSLSLLKTSYIDLYLIHWPAAQGVHANSPDNGRQRIETWKAMIQLHDRGRGVLRAIGVSNFTPKHLEQLIKATGFAPAVNQVIIHIISTDNSCWQIWFICYFSPPNLPIVVVWVLSKTSQAFPI